jgi:hypothetical protein
MYIYKDASGNEIKKGLLQKKDIPTNVKTEVSYTNICDSRIERLQNKSIDANKSNDPNKSNDANTFINPKVCELNLDSSGNPMMLSNEPGINELKMLYMDDEYDYSNGTFKGMSDKMKSVYENDLKTFYTAFTGNPDMPPDITEFSQIKLRAYNKANGCQPQPDKTENMLKTGTMVSKKDELFIKYAENLNTMIKNAQANQQKLMSVITKLFVFVPDPYGDGQKIRVHPDLTDEMLSSIVIETREIIRNLYVKCEEDFANGLKLYEAIVERKILETTKSQDYLKTVFPKNFTDKQLIEKR